MQSPAEKAYPLICCAIRDLLQQEDRGARNLRGAHDDDDTRGRNDDDDDDGGSSG